MNTLEMKDSKLEWALKPSSPRFMNPYLSYISPDGFEFRIFLWRDPPYEWRWDLVDLEKPFEIKKDSFKTTAFGYCSNPKMAESILISLSKKIRELENLP